MKKKVIIQRLREFSAKSKEEKDPGGLQISELEKINGLFEEEKQDQLKLCEARRISSTAAYQSLIKEVIDKLKKIVEEKEFNWLRGRLANFSADLKDAIIEAIIKAGRGEVHQRLDYLAKMKKKV